jgi:hypothetical protein
MHPVLTLKLGVTGVVQLSDCRNYYVCGIPINPVCDSTQLNLVHRG